MFINDRNEAREFFFSVWEKLNQKRPLEPMEAIVADVITEHPEYHRYLDNRMDSLEDDFFPEQGKTNPFLHMGMHIALREQLATNRPAGIASIYQSLLHSGKSAHDIEHDMLECLGECLWRAQRDNSMPDEQQYLACLKRLS